MFDKPKKLGIFSESGPLIALAVAAGILLGLAGPSSAQFFNNYGGYQQRPQPQRGGGGFGGGWGGGGWGGGGWFGNDNFGPQQQAPQPRLERRRQAAPPEREDFSKAPPPEKRETAAERRILVLGDAMADWLAYGLEDAYAEQPDIGVIRRHKTVSGLIKDRRDGGRLKIQGGPRPGVGFAGGTGPKGARRHAVFEFALSRCRRQGRHQLCRCMGRLCR